MDNIIAPIEASRPINNESHDPNEYYSLFHIG